MAPKIGVIMGSQSDWDTMRFASETLDAFGVEHEVKIVSAHRTPDLLFEYAATAKERGLQAIIAGAGGAAHLPGMCASKTTLPVLGVPVESKMLAGVDSLLSIVQMPSGVPVATFAIGKAGAVNAALFACELLALGDATIARRVAAHREKQTREVMAQPSPKGNHGDKIEKLDKPVVEKNDRPSMRVAAISVPTPGAFSPAAAQMAAAMTPPMPPAIPAAPSSSPSAIPAAPKSRPSVVPPAPASVPAPSVPAPPRASVIPPAPHSSRPSSGPPPIPSAFKAVPPTPPKKAGE
jgi:5-(carboxyamino)imidazole ribonucleotide mutase